MLHNKKNDQKLLFYTQKSPENGMILEILTKVFCVLAVFFIRLQLQT